MRKRIFPLILCILLLFSAALPAFAADKGSVTVLFRYENQPITGVMFQIYKAAEWNGNGYTLTEPFDAYSVNVPDDVTDGEWKAMASTLSAYAARDGIPPLFSGQTDKDGKLRFDGLSDGLYLVVGSSAPYGDLQLFPQPMLAAVPYTSADGEKIYEVETEPKYEVRKQEEETITRRALKIWKDNGSESNRPQNITVQLLCDGKLYDEQTLSSANNWLYTWEGLDAGHNWQLIEKQVPENYTVNVTQQDITFIVTNTSNNTITPPPSNPNNPSSQSKPNTPGASNKPTLPNTGMLWWPVAAFGAIGAVTLFFGVYLLMRRKDSSDA